MEKYGVDTTRPDGEKTAEPNTTCPRCRYALESDSTIPKCPIHGTEPFEKDKGEKK